jgi:hypothetical protein
MEEVNEDADVNANGWNDNEVIVTVDVRRVNGKCVLLYDRYEATSDMIVQSIAGFSVELNKVECHTINGNGRWVTFRKLKENLAEKNSSAQWEMSSARNNKSVLSYTAEKYRKLAPGAEVTVSREGASSGRRYYSFDTVTVKFQNGNLLVVAPRRNNDEELVHRFIDVTTANKSAEELVKYLGK